MDKAKFVQRIKQLEEKSTYFGLIMGISTTQECTIKQAWLEVEKMREDMGLPPKYSSYHSVMHARGRFHKVGEMIRIIDPQTDDND